MGEAKSPDSAEVKRSGTWRQRGFFRFLIVDVMAYVIVTLIVEAGRRFLVLDILPSNLLVLFAIFFSAHVLATMAARYPPGVDYVALRLGLAAFCRTIFPLLALLLVEHYLIAVLHRQNLPLIAGFYFLSLGLGLWSASIAAK